MIFTAIDFETANAARASACAVGLAAVLAGCQAQQPDAEENTTDREARVQATELALSHLAEERQKLDLELKQEDAQDV